MGRTQDKSAKTLMADVKRSTYDALFHAHQSRISNSSAKLPPAQTRSLASRIHKAATYQYIQTWLQLPMLGAGLRQTAGDTPQQLGRKKEFPIFHAKMVDLTAFHKANNSYYKMEDNSYHGNMNMNSLIIHSDFMGEKSGQCAGATSSKRS